MNGHVYGLSEIVGTSTQGVDDAIRVGVQRAARTLRGLDWFEVTDIRGHLADGEIEHFQVTLKDRVPDGGSEGLNAFAHARRQPAAPAPGPHQRGRASPRSHRVAGRRYGVQAHHRATPAPLRR